MIGTAKLADKVAAGKAKMEGNPQVLTQLGSTMVKFDNWFEVLPGTKKEAGAVAKARALAGRRDLLRGTLEHCRVIVWRKDGKLGRATCARCGSVAVGAYMAGRPGRLRVQAGHAGWRVRRPCQGLRGAGVSDRAADRPRLSGGPVAGLSVPQGVQGIRTPESASRLECLAHLCPLSRPGPSAAK